MLTNELQLKDNVEIVSPLDNCDYNVLVWEIECTPSTVLNNKSYFCFNQADYNGMRNFDRNRLSSFDYNEM